MVNSIEAEGRSARPSRGCDGRGDQEGGDRPRLGLTMRQEVAAEALEPPGLVPAQTPG
jgi:hypothetical protein